MWNTFYAPLYWVDCKAGFIFNSSSLDSPFIAESIKFYTNSSNFHGTNMTQTSGLRVGRTTTSDVLGEIAYTTFSKLGKYRLE